ISSSSARCLTGLTCINRPRPAGRSGLVNTARIVCAERARASSAGTANAAVPAKPSVKGLCGVFKTLESRRRSANLAPRGTLSTLFFQAPAYQLALELGEVIDE